MLSNAKVCKAMLETICTWLSLGLEAIFSMNGGQQQQHKSVALKINDLFFKHKR